jgi:hypothetical protein
VCAPRAPLVEARTQGLHVVVACWIGGVTGFLGLEVLGGVRRGVVKHRPAYVAVVGSVVVPVHRTVKSWADVRTRRWAPGSDPVEETKETPAVH